MRPDLGHYMMSLAQLAASRTTCIRRGVGCVLTNERGHILAIAYNGVAAGLPHCNEPSRFQQGPSQPIEVRHHEACVGYDLPPGKDQCEAIHAEQNALLQCRDPWEIETAYVTLSPCKPCLKLLLNTSCRRIVFLEEHVLDKVPEELWRKAGREWINLRSVG